MSESSDDGELCLEAMDVDEASKGKREVEDDGDDQEQQPENKKQCIVSIPRLRPSAPSAPPTDETPSYTGVKVWQLTKEEAADCLFAWCDWMKLYEEFKNVPASEDKDAQAANHKILAALSEELFHIWTHGRSKSAAAPHAGRVVQAQSIAHTMFYGTKQFNDSPAMSQSDLDGKFETIAAYVTGLFDMHRLHNFCNSGEPAHDLSMSHANRVLMALQNAHRMLTHACAMERVLNPAVNSVIPSKHALFSVENFREYQTEMDNAKGHIKVRACARKRRPLRSLECPLTAL